MTSADVQTRWLSDWSRLPSNVELAADPSIADDPILAGSMAALSIGRGQPAAAEMRCAWDAWRPNLEGVMAGTTTRCMPPPPRKRLRTNALPRSAQPLHHNCYPVIILLFVRRGGKLAPADCYPVILLFVRRGLYAPPLLTILSEAGMENKSPHATISFHFLLDWRSLCFLVFLINSPYFGNHS